MAKSGMKKKLERIFDGSKEADVILIANTSSKDPNFSYITGIVGGLFEGNILLLKRDSAKLITNQLEYELAASQKPADLELINASDAKQIKGILVRELRGKRVGVNQNAITLDLYDKLKSEYRPKEILRSYSAFSDSRSIKDDEEISKIRKAAEITKKAMELIKKEFKVGVTEREIAQKFDYTCRNLGSESPSFDTIVAFGKNAAMPHHAPTDDKLRYGDIIKIDAGSKFGNYCSDITRTVIFGDDKGRIKDYSKKLEIIEIVKSAQKAAIKAIKPGMKGKDIHKIANDYINNAAGGIYKGTFIHGLGHSLGLEVHDSSKPRLSPLSDDILKPNMVVTVEPGIYISGFGGARIEDDILITKDGAEIL